LLVCLEKSFAHPRPKLLEERALTVFSLVDICTDSYGREKQEPGRNYRMNRKQWPSLAIVIAIAACCAAASLVPGAVSYFHQERAST